jgi:hypothetical protein
MSEADRAVEAALSFEAKKDGLAQKQDGTWKVTLTVAELPSPVKDAHMGTRYMVALVEVGDDELPVDHEKKARAEGARAPFHTLPLVQQAGILCKDLIFQRYIIENRFVTEYKGREIADFGGMDWEASTIFLVKKHLEVGSRTELSFNMVAANKWRLLVHEYEISVGLAPDI